MVILKWSLITTRKRRMIKSILRFVVYTVCILLMMWMLVSWLDVLMHNDPITGDHVFLPINAFVIITQIGG